MTCLNRYTNQTRSSNQSTFNRVTRFIRNTGVVTKLLDHGYAPGAHDSLPKPFVSIEVETEAGKRYIVRLEGVQAMELNVVVGITVYYEGRFFGPYKDSDNNWHGGFFHASTVEVEDKGAISDYVKHLMAVKVRMDQEAETASKTNERM